MSILLVSVVSYCDPEFFNTIKNLWESAENKNNLIFSLVSEDETIYDFSFIPANQLIYRHFDVNEYRGGLCWARNLAVDVDVKYDYLIQFDSHTHAEMGWDTLAVNNYLKVFKKMSKKFIFAFAPPEYSYDEFGKKIFNITFNNKGCVADDYSSLSPNGDFAPGFGFPAYSAIKPDNVFVRGYWATCCYLMAPKQWVDEVGINKDESFNTEEISLSIRNFAKNWEIYAASNCGVFHNTSHKQPDGSVTREVKRPWADGRKEDYWSHVTQATNRLSELMSGQLDVSKESVQAFFEKTGIDKKFLTYIPNYSSYIVNPKRGYGMPPRRD